MRIQRSYAVAITSYSAADPHAAPFQQRKPRLEASAARALRLRPTCLPSPSPTSGRCTGTPARVPPAPASARHAGAGRSRRPHTKAASRRPPALCASALSTPRRRPPDPSFSASLRRWGAGERRPRKMGAGGVPQRGRVGPHDAISDASPFPAWGPARPPNRRGIRTAPRLACSDLIIVFYDDLIIVSPCGQNISISDDSVYFRHDLGLYSVRNRDQSGITSTSPDPCWLAMQKTPKNECISLRRLNRHMRSPN